MEVELSGEYKPSPQAIAEEIWEMDSEEQLDLLYFLANIADKAAIYRQMVAINDELKENFENYADVVNFVKDLEEYITGKDYE